MFLSSLGPVSSAWLLLNRVLVYKVEIQVAGELVLLIPGDEL